ncbi:MAG: protein kinase [Gammaproteobacteria bacterium]|nr:protein kinase [Gammaproteobacteria bacterium]
MLDLKDRLVQFSREEISMADLKRVCLRFAEEDPERVLRILSAACGAELISQGEYEALQYALASGSSDRIDDEDATVIRSWGGTDQDEADKTLVRAAVDEKATALPTDERLDDKTVVRAGLGDTADDTTVLNDPGRLDGASQSTNKPDTSEDTTLMRGQRPPAPSITDDTDVTVVNSESEAADATVVNTMADDTRVSTGDDDFNVSDPSGVNTAVGIATGYDDTFDPSVLQGLTPAVDRVFTKGSMLKDRFRLTDALGEGGMGTVWKAVDILKVEAEDRNPFVAIKLLQGDFKAHPESFIALQRESSKQQRLAHPNIATVFDFDREAESGTVFMTMEVMDGSDLADFIKTIAPGGLDYEEAMDLIEQLGAGLAYAHEAGLVHSDLKPGNCFLTKDGRVKLLDFGIARASATRDDAEGEQTKFDPGELGALTPSYATVEMFNGEDPDPRDDIYAMAIIAYQLFTGKHPYNRRPAPKALERGLTPDYIDKLTKRQNKALADGLALLRGDRTASVEAFLTGLRPYKRNLALTVGLPAAFIAALVAGLWFPVANYLERLEREAILAPLEETADAAAIGKVIDQAVALGDAEKTDRILGDDLMVGAIVALLKSADETSVRAGLALTVDTRLGDAISLRIKSDKAAQASVTALYQRHITAAFAPDADPPRYDFAGALAQLAKLKNIYGGTDGFVQVRDDLYASRDKASEVQRARITQLAQAGRLEVTADDDDVGDAVAVLRALHPELLVEAGVRSAVAEPALQRREYRKRWEEIIGLTALEEIYVAAVTAAVGEQDYARAQRALEAGLAYIRDTPQLSRLNLEVVTELARIRDERRAQELHAYLGPRWGAWVELAQFNAVRGELLELAELRPQSELLAAVRGKLEALLDGAMANAGAQSARALLAEYAALLDFDGVRTRQQRLSQAPGTKGLDAGGPDAGGPEAERRDVAVKAARAALAKPAFSAEWNASLTAAMKTLTALLAPGDAVFIELKNRAGKILLARARELVEHDQYDQAFAMLERARAIYPQWQDYVQARRQVSAAKEEYERIEAERERLVRLETLRQTVIARANDNEPDAAKAALVELRAELPQDDTFVASEAPQAIAASYLRLAVTQAVNGDFEIALRLIDNGLELAPKMNGLAQAREQYLAEILDRAVATQLPAPVPPPRASSTPAVALPVVTPVPHNMPRSSSDSAGLDGSDPGSAASGQAVVTDAGTLDFALLQIGTSPIDMAAAVPMVIAQPAAQPAFALKYPALTGAMAERVADAIVASSKPAPDAIAQLRGPLESYRALFPDVFVEFEERLAAVAAQSVRSVLDDGDADVRPLTAPLAGFEEAFPAYYDALAATLGGETGAALIQAVKQAPGDIAAAVTLLGHYAPLFHERASVLRAEVGGILAEQVLADAKREGSSGSGLEPALVALRADFAQSAVRIESRLANVLIEHLMKAIDANPGDATVLQRSVAAFKRLLPDADTNLANRVVPVFLDGLTEQVKAAPERLSAIGQPLADVIRLFPDAERAAAQRLAPVATEALAGLIRQEPLPEVVRLAGSLGELFPGARGEAEARLVPMMSERLLEHARAGNFVEMSAGMAAVKSVYPDVAQGVERRLIPVVAEVLASRAGTTGIDRMKEDIEAVRRLLPGSAAQLERKLAPVFTGVVAKAAGEDTADLAGLGRALAAFRSLFPASVGELEQRMADALIESIIRRADISNIGRLRSQVTQFSELLPAHRGTLEASLAASLTVSLREEVSDTPAKLLALTTPINEYRRLLPGQADTLGRVVGSAALDAIERATRVSPHNLELAGARVQALGKLFPQRLPDARERVAPLVAESVVIAAQKLATDVKGAGHLIDAFAAVFPDYAGTVRSDVAQAVWRAIEAQVEKDPSQLAPVVPLLVDYAQAFPTDYAELSGALAARSARVIQRQARDTGAPLVRVGRSLKEFKKLFPQRYAQLARDVGGALFDRLAGSNITTAQSVKELASALAQIKTMFPERFTELELKLGNRIAKEVTELIAPAPFKADALRSAGLEVFPSNAALGAISFELPLREVEEGYNALAKGLLTKARQLLDAAEKKNSLHSTLPAFKKALREQERKALDAYQSYRKVVRTNPRKQTRDKALKAARALWRDNPKFVDVKPPAANACIVNKAGLGQRTPCYDKVGRRRRDIGPLMVVVPAGTGVAAPFAISKYEISVTDFNRYCLASKECKAKRAKRALPVTQVSRDQIERYAAWLSKLSGATYRLPNEAEWVHAANAGGEQPKRDFNCTVVIGNQQLKGVSLTGYKSGSPNGWGLINYLGNAQELVTTGDGGLAARGGMYQDKLNRCTVDLSRSHDGTPDAVTGFRLVRLINRGN